MAIDHAKDGVRVNCIAPGPMYTPMVSSAGMSAEARDLRRRASPLGIEGTGWDVGYAALFLASDEARYITGVVLPVDGGVTISSPHEGTRTLRASPDTDEDSKDQQNHEGGSTWRDSIKAAVLRRRRPAPWPGPASRHLG